MQIVYMRMLIMPTLILKVQFLIQVMFEYKREIKEMLKLPRIQNWKMPSPSFKDCLLLVEQIFNLLLDDQSLQVIQQIYSKLDLVFWCHKIHQFQHTSNAYVLIFLCCLLDNTTHSP